MTAVLEIAERFFRAIEKGDIEAVRATYAPNAVIWHNNDGKEQSPDENLRVLSWVIRNLSDRQYRVVRRAEIPGGFMQQHVLEAKTTGGPFSMPACIVCQVENGQITRLDEYLDSAQSNQLVALTSGSRATGQV